MNAEPDKRLHAYRDDLADERLRNRVRAATFVAGTPVQFTAPVSGLRAQPSEEAAQVTQALKGETARVFETRNDWSWVQLDGDSYVGHVRAACLSKQIQPPSHKVTAPSTFRFSKANIKSPPLATLPLGARFKAESEEGDFLRLKGEGFIYALHCAPAPALALDWVAVAERFLFTPYLWGGKTAYGIDCSGLVQVCLQAAGKSCPRDSDMQEAALGIALPRGEALRRGDLVFWKGHVGIMRDATTLLHANGHNLMVVSEPLEAAVRRMAEKESQVTAIKRLQ